MKGRSSLFLGALAGVVVGIAAGRLYHHRTRGRIPGPEGLDDPEITAAYNQVALFPHMRLMRAVLARLAVRRTPAGRALDLGCGPGLLVAALAQDAPGLHVTGLDLSEEMLADARAYVQSQGLADRTDFRRGDAGEIPFPDGSFDLVISTLSLHHWSNPVGVLREIDRVLRPGGAFVIADLRRDLSAPGWLAIWFATQIVVPPALKQANEPLASRDASYTPEEAAALADQAGLEGYRVTQGPLWLILEGIKGRALHPPLPLQWRVMRFLNREVAGRVKPDEKAPDLVLLLQTTGRITGRPHNTFLQYELWDGGYFVGSARGLEADWFRNLVAHPEVRVRLKGEWHPAIARPITAQDRVLAFLELRLDRHPAMIRGMLLSHGLPRQPSREDLAVLAEKLAIVELRLQP